MLAQLFAAIAMLLQPGTLPSDFDAIVRCDTPIVDPGTFIGCESRSADGDERLYAGLVWIDGVAVPQVGP